MKNWKFLTLCATTLSSTLIADTVESNRNIEDNDIRALRDWINTKRQVSLKEIGGDLSISGEVRTEFQSNWELVNGVNPRGHGDKDKPNQVYDIEFNLILDYRTDRTWAAIKIEFDNRAGSFNGTLNALSLERCYWGARAYEGSTNTFDVEIGRRFMGTVFDSRIQFGSLFDGILLRYNQAFEKVGDFFIHTGVFVVNGNVNQFGYIGEIGLLNIGGTGLYSKLSCIAWDTKNYSDPVINERMNFIIGQFSPGYRFRIECINKMCLIYSALLWNFAAKKVPNSDFQRANYGAYAGFSIGQLLKQWDWAIDANYQVVAAQSIPDFDTSGIGLGNANGRGFYTNFVRPIGGDGPVAPFDAQGNVNYKGFTVRFDLLLTDKLDMQQIYQQADTFNNDIGPHRTYKFYELEFIYSW